MPTKQPKLSSIKKRKCESCGKLVPSYDTINLGSKDGKSRELCTSCYNAEMSLYGGANFEHVAFAPVKIKDVDKVSHEFHFRVRSLCAKVAIDAFELIRGYPDGFMFTVVADAEDDILMTYKKLHDLVHLALSRKHIEKRDGEMGICEEGVVRGRISSERFNDELVPSLVIDGKEISWEEFGRMIMTYEGFQFKLQMLDHGDET